MTKTWDEFYPYIQPHVASCPEDTITDYLRRAAIEFCERSEVWRRRLETDYTVAGVSDYQLSVPNKALLENITSLFLNDLPLSRVDDTSVRNYPGTGTGRPLWYSVHDDAEVRFYPAPDARYPIVTDCVLKPALDATGVDDFVYFTHVMDISCGTLGMLMMIPDKPWTNQEMAAYYNMKFYKAADDAKGRDTRRSNRRVAGPKFA